jgi:hypothetical protein
MTTKSKSLQIIDAQTVSNSAAPNSRKTKFNPYTGGIIANDTDRPTFGKYTMEFRSGTSYTSCEVKFFKKKVGKKSYYVTMQFPIPNATLLVRNPNFDIIQSIVFLALNRDALAGVDNEGVYEDTEKTPRAQDRYVSFVPNKRNPIIKNAISTDIKPHIIRLFQKYTIYEFLLEISGQDYSSVTDDNILIQAVQDNFQNIPIFAEAGFNNDSDSTLDGYFIRRAIATRFSFDKAYLDNPSLKPFTLKATTTALTINFSCKNLRKIIFDVYASPTGTFDYTKTPLKRIVFDVTGLVNPTYSINLSSLNKAQFNDFTEFKKDADLLQVINSRKWFSVKIRSIFVSSGIEKVEIQFKDFFNLDKDTDTTKKVELTYNVPRPILATYIPAIPFDKQPYFLNLVNNSRKFFFRIEIPNAGVFDPKAPAGISGFLIRYVNTPSTNSNTLRYFSLDHPDVKLEVDGFVPSGSTTAYYYYSITDFFKRPASPENTFKLDVPFAAQMYVYLVDKYYYTSNSPLSLENVVQYNLVNYLTSTTFGRFILIDSSNNNTILTFNDSAFQRTPRHNLTFILETTAAKESEVSPPVGAVWKAEPQQYSVSFNHGYGNSLDYTALAVGVYKKGSSVPETSINLNYLFTRFSRGSKEGLWIRFKLVTSYTTTQTLPYTGTILGLYKRTF